MLEEWAGGCQCGAVRYELSGRPTNPCICHCRMCQKAVGGPFAVICPVLKTDFRLTRGESLIRALVGSQAVLLTLVCLGAPDSSGGGGGFSGGGGSSGDY